MTSLRLPLPEPFDLVPVEDVERLVADTDREFQLLERQAADALAAADAAEARRRELPWDDASTTWAIVRLQRFLDQLRQETDQERAAILEVAELRARLIVREAELRGVSTRTDDELLAQLGPIAPPPPGPVPLAARAAAPDLDAALFGGAGPSAPLGVPVEPPPVPDVAEPPAPVVAPVTPPIVDPPPLAPMPLPVVEPPTIAYAAPAPAPAAHGNGSTATLVAPAEPSVLDAMSADHDVTNAIPVVGHTVAQPGPPEFWIVEDAVERRRFAPLAALLEIAAVLLILVFILIRLS